MSTQSTVSNVRNINDFYSYPAWLISSWLGVCLRTAKRYKAGHRVPRPALRLFTLLRDRRVLAHEAWAGWSVDGERLQAPGGESVTPGMLNAWFLVYQERDELRRELDRVRRSPANGSSTSWDVRTDAERAAGLDSTSGQTYRPSQAKRVSRHAARVTS